MITSRSLVIVSILLWIVFNFTNRTFLLILQVLTLVIAMILMFTGR